jgi:PPK2 family polyphosphate:nucleotide phosphotransferase
MKSRKAASKPRVDRFRVRPGHKVDLKEWDTRVADLYSDEDDAQRQLASQVARTSELQDKFYATDRHSLLLIFQAMDAAGKDGAVKHVLSGVNPQGCQVASFKQPSFAELDHDFLWRTTLQMPERGRIGVFNRSYYEEVLVARVHPEFLTAQRLPASPVPDSKEFWRERMRSIEQYEAHLHRNGTVIVKFFLHVSKEVQRERFLERIDHPGKNWKFNVGDVEERRFWSDYMRAYEQALSATSTRDSPWYVIPADDKKNARIIMSAVVNQTLESLDLAYPQLDKKRLAELQTARALIEA